MSHEEKMNKNEKEIEEMNIMDFNDSTEEDEAEAEAQRIRDLYYATGTLEGIDPDPIHLGALGKEILGWIIPLTIAVVVALVLKYYVIINANVPSGSMEDTIATNDDLVGWRLSYLFSDPQRGDIVIFHYPDDETQLFIKRIVGLPGESVAIIDGKIYIDGAEEPLEEDYLKEEWVVATGTYYFEIPEDSYLMLGDNRNNSKDARYWANCYVSRDKIVGKAAFIYFPFNHIKKLN